MFTGIVEHCTQVLSFNTLEINGYLELKNPFSQVKLGESIAVNGVCLTVEKVTQDTLSFVLSTETLNVTNLKQLKPGDRVNCEQALLASSRMGGHYVTGHIDTTSSVTQLVAHDDCSKITVGGFSDHQLEFLIPKGSITLDGISLTINSVQNNSISLMLIPHTLANTTWCNIKEGHTLNVEFDYIARIVAHQRSVYYQLTNEIPL